MLQEAVYLRTLEPGMDLPWSATMNFEELLKFAVDQGASDIHFQSGSAPQVRIGGLIRNVESPAISQEGAHRPARDRHRRRIDGRWHRASTRRIVLRNIWRHLRNVG